MIGKQPSAAVIVVCTVLIACGVALPVVKLLPPLKKELKGLHAIATLYGPLCAIISMTGTVVVASKVIILFAVHRIAAARPTGESYA